METKNVKISVLMLTYNCEQYVDEAIRGVMAQRCSHNYELVIGDDASTDGTVDRCRRWADKYPGTIMLLTNEHNTGLLANYARSYVYCRGEYMAICEGDDYWTDRSKLQRQADFLDSHPDYSMCVHRVVNYYEEDGSKSLSNGGQKADNDILDLARSNFITNVSVMYRHCNVPVLPVWMQDVATYDYAMHMLNAEHGRVWYMGRCMAVYRKRRSALWSRAGAEKQYRMAMQVRRVLMRHFRDAGRNDVYELLRKAYADNAIALLRHYMTIGVDAATVKVRADEFAGVDDSLDADSLLTFARVVNKPRGVKRHVEACIKRCVRYMSRFFPVPHAPRL